MPYAGGSFSLAASTARLSISTVAVSAPRFPTVCCRAPRAGCSPGWESVSSFSTVILVEGLFDLAVLWQAGFRNTTCAIGTQLTPAQLVQLSDQPGRSVYIVFDQDDNQAGQKAAQQLTQRLQSAAICAHIVRLPHGHDPNSYFVAGASAADFTACLQGAHKL